MLAAIRDNDTDALAAILAGLPAIDPAFEIGCRPPDAPGPNFALPPLSCELRAALDRFPSSCAARYDDTRASLAVLSLTLDAGSVRERYRALKDLNCVVRGSMSAVYGPGIAGLAVCHPFYHAAVRGRAASLEIIAGWCRPTAPALDDAVILALCFNPGRAGQTECVAWLCARIPFLTAAVCYSLYRSFLVDSAVWAAILDSTLDNPWRLDPDIRSSYIMQGAVPGLDELLRRAEARRGSPARWAWVCVVVRAAFRR